MKNPFIHFKLKDIRNAYEKHFGKMPTGMTYHEAFKAVCRKIGVNQIVKS